MGSGSSKARGCPKHGVMSCPICGSTLVEIEYRGGDAKTLALMKRADFRGFVGCVRADLHDKVVDGVRFSGKVFVKPVLSGRR